MANLKVAMHVSFDQNCLHLTLKLYFSSDSYSCDKKKAKYSCPCMLTYYRKKTVENVAHKVVFFMFRPITLKQLDSLTSTDTIHSVVSTAERYRYRLWCEMSRGKKIPALVMTFIFPFRVAVSCQQIIIYIKVCNLFLQCLFI